MSTANDRAKGIKISKATVDAAKPAAGRYVLWDTALPGFGLTVSPSGLKTFILRYRAKHRFAPKRFIKLGKLGPLTPDEARRKATHILGKVADGQDPALAVKQENLHALKFHEVCDRFIEHHVRVKRKANTLALYSHVMNSRIKPFFGSRNFLKVTRQDVAQFHNSMKETPVLANRAVAGLGAMYSWASRAGLIDEGINPANRIEKFREVAKDRYLSLDEIERLGHALTEAETTGIEYQVDLTNPKVKHAPKPENRKAVQSPFAVAAIRLLILTGCRVGEILNLQWQDVDLERGFLHLSDSKTGKKSVIVGKAAMAVIDALPRNGKFVIPGAKHDLARTDLKRPWNAIRKRAGLEDVRLHDLRHSFASVGAGAGLGLPVIGKLLGHSQASTTARYAHFADHPVKRAADSISSQIAKTMGLSIFGVDMISNATSRKAGRDSNEKTD